jgi:hypothetical protein
MAVIPHGNPCEHCDEQTQGGSKISMHHFLDGFVILEGPMREGLVDYSGILRCLTGR